MGLPGKWLGTPSKNLIKTITKIHKTYGNYGRQQESRSSWEITYKVGDDNLVSEVNVGGRVFKIRYLPFN